MFNNSFIRYESVIYFSLYSIKKIEGYTLAGVRAVAHCALLIKWVWLSIIQLSMCIRWTIDVRRYVHTDTYVWGSDVRFNTYTSTYRYCYCWLAIRPVQVYHWDTRIVMGCTYVHLCYCCPSRPSVPLGHWDCNRTYLRTNVHPFVLLLSILSKCTIGIPGL